MGEVGLGGCIVVAFGELRVFFNLATGFADVIFTSQDLYFFKAGCESSSVTLLKLSRNNRLSCSSTGSSYSPTNTSLISCVDTAQLNLVFIMGLVNGVISVSACPKCCLFHRARMNYISSG